MALHAPPRRPQCLSAGRVTARLLLSFLALSTGASASLGGSSPSSSSQQEQQHGAQHPIPLLPALPIPGVGQPLVEQGQTFSLRHIFHHGVHEYPDAHRRLDVPPSDTTLWVETDEGSFQRETRPLVARSLPVHIQRLKDRRPAVVDPMIAAARESGDTWTLSPSAWTIDELPGPNVTDKDTVITLAQMAANAYVDKPDQGDWKDVNGGFNRTDDHGFGWDSDGLRGYIYTTDDGSTIVIGLKGTSLAIYDGDGTTTNDKENDNLFFGCCCGQGSVFYRSVCDCATGTYTCNTTCLATSLRQENRYYAAARHLYGNVSALYPDANIWMSGHSLGGSLGAMLGLTYGIPAVTFQAVPDALPAARLGLPAPPGHDSKLPQKRELTGAYHFGHTADPIYMGTCNGVAASCTYAGYSLETACHTGQECVYDVVGDKGWRVNVATHRIIRVIEDILKVYDTVPVCKYEPECQDCPLWKEVTGNATTTTSQTTTSTSTNTRTRTATCKTPGWWGCLDETTTTEFTTTSASTTTTTSTSTCKTPGWFGCNDEKTTTSAVSTTVASPTPTATTTSTAPTSSTTCQSPGFFGGCNDPTTTTTSTTSTPSQGCERPGYFYGCHDKSTTTQGHSITSAPLMPASTTTAPATSIPTGAHQRSRCLRRSWLGFCRKWEPLY